MMNFFSYIAYCFSLIPSWLTFVFIFLCVFLAVYLCIGLFYNEKNTLKVIDSQDDFDRLLSQVLSSKDSKKNGLTPSTTSSASPKVVAAITAAVATTLDSDPSEFSISSIQAI